MGSDKFSNKGEYHFLQDIGIPVLCCPTGFGAWSADRTVCVADRYGGLFSAAREQPLRERGRTR